MRPSHKTILFVIFSLLTFSAQANCPLPESAQSLECKGTFKAQSIADIEAYKTDYKVKNGLARNLKIDFNVDTTELNIASPCNIIVAKERNVNASGNICLTSKKKIIFKHGGHINAADMTLTSVGTDELSRVHIRNTKDITVNNLTLKAYSRATLGHTSNYYVSGNVKLETTGEGRFSSIWRDTTVNANSITLVSTDKTRLSKGVVLNAPVVNLDGIECNVNKSVVINSENIMGNCLSGAHPTARIKSDVKEGAIPLTVNFDFSNSTDDGGITKYVFDPADGSPVVELTTPSYSHTYTVAGTYKAKLVVYDEGGLKDTRKKKIKALDPNSNQAPSASFTMSKNTAVVGESVTFDASASSDDKAIVEYAWDFTDTASKDVSEPVTSYTFMEAGAYEVTLVVIDAEGLEGETSKTITITEDSSDDSAPKAYFKFERSAEDNDGSEETFLLLEFFGEAGSTPLVSAEYEIIQTGEKYSPRDLYTGTKTEIEGLPFGIYDVKLTVTDQAGKSNSFTHNVVLNGDDQDPILDFEVEQSGVNSAFLSLLNSFDPVDFAFEFDIDWGDGNSDSLSDDLGASHTYVQAGTYNVTVTFNSPEVGTSTTLSKSVTVSAENTEPLEPVANYVRWQEDFAGHVRFYEELSLSPNGEIVSFHWDFGDGSEGYGEEVAHFYAPGVYLVTLTVTDPMGMRDTQVQRVVITEPGPPTLVGGDCWADDTYATCFAVALDDFEQLTEVSIDWGDGVFDVEIADNQKWFEFEKGHQYQGSGSYNVTVTANTIRGETVSFERTIETNGGSGGQSPIADFFCSQDELVVNCNNYSFDPDGFITSISWNMGDGTIYSDVFDFLQHEYQNPGDYTISVTVTDNDQITSQSSQAVTVYGGVNEVPIASLFCRSTVVNQLVCDIDGEDSDGTIVSKRLSFDDGTSIDFGAGPETYTHTFTSGGAKTVTLKVVDNEGAEGTTSAFYDVKSNQAPVVAFSCFSGVPNEIACSSSSTDDTGIASQTWDMSDGTILSGQDITHTYSEGGTKSIKLTVVDNEGLSSELIKSETVVQNTLPIANFNCVRDDEVALRANCVNTSTDSDGEITTAIWKRSGVVIGSGNNIAIDFNGITEDITLDIIDNLGGESSLTKAITTKIPSLNAQIVCKQTENYSANCRVITNIEKGEINEFTWLRDGVVLGNEVELAISSDTAESFNLTLRITGLLGQLTEELNYVLTMDELSPSYFPSSVKLTIIEPENGPFYNINEDLIFNITEGAIKYNEDNKPEDFSIIYDNDLEIQDFTIDNSSITIQQELVQGSNSFSIQFIDDEGKTFYEEYEVFAGSKEVTLNFSNVQDLNTDNNLKAIFTNSPDSEFSFDFKGNSLTINNFPFLDAGIFVRSNEYTEISYLGKDEQQKDLTLDSFTSEINSENMDFSQGIQGWNIAKGDYELTDKINDIFNQIPNEGQSLSLSPSLDGEIHIQTNFKNESEDTGYIRMPFQMFSSDPRSFLLIKIRNIQTNEEKLKLIKGDSLHSNSNLPNQFLSNSNIGKFSAGELYEYEIYFKSFEEESFVNNILKDIYNFFLPKKAFAQNSRNSIINLVGVYSSEGLLDNLRILDGQEHSIGEELTTFIERPFPTNYDNIRVTWENGVSTAENVYAIATGVDYTGAQSSNLLQYRIHICEESEPIQSFQNCLTTRIDANGFSSFRESELSFNGNFVRMCVSVENILNKRVFAHECLNQAFPLKVSLSGLGFISGEDSNPAESRVRLHRRYGARDGDGRRDLEDGGDDWVKKTHLNIVNELLGENVNYYIGKDVYNVKLDDAAPTGASRRDGFGHSKAHETGLKLDLRWQKINETLNNVERSDLAWDRKNEKVTSIWDAFNLFQFLNSHGRHIKNVLVTFDEDSKTDDFTLFHKSSILQNCQKMSDIVQFKSNHGDHIDVEIYDILSDGTIPSKNLCSHVPSLEIVEAIHNEDENSLDVFGIPSNLKEIEIFVRNDEKGKMNYSVNNKDGSNTGELISIPIYEELSSFLGGAFSYDKKTRKLSYDLSKLYKDDEDRKNKGFVFKFNFGFAVPGSTETAWREAGFGVAINLNLGTTQIVEPITYVSSEISGQLSVSLSRDESKLYYYTGSKDIRISTGIEVFNNQCEGILNSNPCVWNFDWVDLPVKEDGSGREGSFVLSIGSSSGHRVNLEQVVTVNNDFN